MATDTDAIRKGSRRKGMEDERGEEREGGKGGVNCDWDITSHYVMLWRESCNGNEGKGQGGEMMKRKRIGGRDEQRYGETDW